MNHTGIQRILRNSVYLYMTLLMSQGLRFIYVFCIARLLGAELYGVLAFGNAWYMMFLPLTGLGLGIYLSQKVSKNLTKSASRTVPLVASIRFVAVTIVASVCLSAGLINADNELIFNIIIIYTIALVGRAMVLWSTQMFQAYEQTIYVFKLERVFRPLEVSIGIVVAFWTQSVLMVATVHALGIIIQGIISVIWVNKYLVKVKLIWRPKIMAAIVWKLLPLGVAVALGQFLFQGPVVLLKQIGITLVQVGNFSLAIQIFVVFLSIFSSIRAAALPALSRQAKFSPIKLQNYSHYSIVLALVFGCICSSVVTQFAEQFMVLLFTEKFRLAGSLLSVLIWAIIPAIAHNMLNSTQAALEHNKSILFINSIGALSLLLGVIYFVDTNFIEGGAYAVIFGFGSAAVSSMLYLVYKGLLTFFRGFIFPLAVGGLTYFTMHYSSEYMSSFLVVIISLIPMLFLTWFLLIQSDDKKLIISKLGLR